MSVYNDDEIVLRLTSDGWIEAANRIKQLAEENERLREALEVFANPRNWDTDESESIWNPREDPAVLPTENIWEFAQEALDAK